MIKQKSQNIVSPITVIGMVVPKPQTQQSNYRFTRVIQKSSTPLINAKVVMDQSHTP